MEPTAEINNTTKHADIAADTVYIGDRLSVEHCGITARELHIDSIGQLLVANSTLAFTELGSLIACDSRFQDVTYMGPELDTVTLYDSSFINCKFDNLTIDEPEDAGTFKGVATPGHLIRGCYFENCTFTGLQGVENLAVQQCQFKNCKFVGLDSRPAQISRSFFTRGSETTYIRDETSPEAEALIKIINRARR